MHCTVHSKPLAHSQCVPKSGVLVLPCSSGLLSGRLTPLASCSNLSSGELTDERKAALQEEIHQYDDFLRLDVAEGYVRPRDRKTYESWPRMPSIWLRMCDALIRHAGRLSGWGMRPVGGERADWSGHDGPLADFPACMLCFLSAPLPSLSCLSRLVYFRTAYRLYDAVFYVKADDDIYLRPGEALAGPGCAPLC